MIKYNPTKRGVFAKHRNDKTYTLAMQLVGHTVHVIAVETTFTDSEIQYIAMAWYPNATNVKIER